MAQSASSTEAPASAPRAIAIGATAAAGAYGGIVLGDLLDIDSDAATIGVIGTSAAGSLLLARATLRGRVVSSGTASSYAVGVVAGLGNGALLAPERPRLGIGLSAMAAGGAVGVLTGNRLQPTAAQARLVGLVGVSGLASAGVTAQLLDVDGRDARLMLVAGMDVGLIGGAALARGLDWSTTRMTYVAISEAGGGVAGLLAAVALSSAGVFAEDGGRDASFGIAALGGMCSGLALGIVVTRDMRPHRRYAASDGASVVLAPLPSAGGAPGIGVAGAF
jgi:hypothetical protein